MSAVLKNNRGSLILGQSWDEYRAIRAVNHSTLKVLDHSPKHYRHNLSNPTETDALRLGIAAHCAVLEPKRFASDFAVWRERKANGDTLQRRGEEWRAFVAANPGCTIITEDQETDALTMQLAISGCREAMEYLSHGDPEVTLLWEMNGRACKGRVDWLTHLGKGPVLVGIKTAADVRIDFFSRAAARLLYHCQWPFYLDAYETITGVRPVEVVEIVVEKKPPYDVVVYVIDDDVLEIGRAKYLQLLERLDHCESENDWPGVGGGGKQLFQLPQYMYDESDLSDLGLVI
jgi:hypothetical protein